MAAPLIGLTGRRKLGKEILGFPGALAERNLDLYFSSYGDRIVEAGGLPVLLPVGYADRGLIERLDALVLTGGADLEPSLYGQAPDGNGFYEPARDGWEFDLLSMALAAGLPILGICRGIQVLNVFFGGDLHQHVPSHAHFESDPSRRVHEVTIAPDSALAPLYPEVLKVNSLHHQAISTVGEGLRVIAADASGSVEAVENAERCLLGVQWHPEMHGEPEPVFDWLVERAKDHAVARAEPTTDR